MKLSVVISAYNEEKNIEECLKSAGRVADEIIFIDNSSTDKTSSIAKKYTKNIFSRDNNKMLNINKNYGISKATGDWVLVLDADERVTDGLAVEIKNTITSHDPKEGYKIPRKNIIFGKWIQHTGWYPDYQTRLFQKGKGKFAEKNNHEQLTVQGDIAPLTENLYHVNYETIGQFLHKMISTYTDAQVESLVAEGRKFKHSDILTSPMQEFLSRYFAREGYKDGFHGLVLSLLQAFDHFIVALKMWEKEKFTQLSEKEATRMLGEKLKTMKKEYSYWETEKNIKKAPPLKKAILKAKRKFA